MAFDGNQAYFIHSEVLTMVLVGKACKHALVLPENTHLLRKGKYHCMADLLFDWFGFSCFVELKL